MFGGGGGGNILEVQRKRLHSRTQLWQHPGSKPPLLLPDSWSGYEDLCIQQRIKSYTPDLNFDEDASSDWGRPGLCGHYSYVQFLQQYWSEPPLDVGHPSGHLLETRLSRSHRFK